MMRAGSFWTIGNNPVAPVASASWLGVSLASLRRMGGLILGFLLLDKFWR